jgi:hypothetical protein
MWLMLKFEVAAAAADDDDDVACQLVVCALAVR